MPPWATRTPNGPSSATNHASVRIPSRDHGLWGRPPDRSPSDARTSFASSSLASASPAGKGLYSLKSPKSLKSSNNNKRSSQRSARPPQRGRVLQSLFPRYYAMHHPRCDRCAIPFVPGVSGTVESSHGVRCAGCDALTPSQHKHRSISAMVATPPASCVTASSSVADRPDDQLAPTSWSHRRQQTPMTTTKKMNTPSLPQPGKPMTIEQKLAAAKAERRARKKAESLPAPTNKLTTPAFPSVSAVDSATTASLLPSAAPDPILQPAQSLDERIEVGTTKVERNRIPTDPSALGPSSSTDSGPHPRPFSRKTPPVPVFSGKNNGGLSSQLSTYGSGSQPDKETLKALLDAKRSRDTGSDSSRKKPKLGLRALLQ